MEITEVRIFPRESVDKKLRAYAAVTFDNSFVAVRMWRTKDLPSQTIKNRIKKNYIRIWIR